MRPFVLLLALLIATPAIAARITDLMQSPKSSGLEGSPNDLKDKIVAVMKQHGKVNVLEDESKCQSKPDNDSVYCSIFVSGHDAVAIYGSSTRTDLVRVIPASDDFYYVTAATVVAVNLDRDLSPYPAIVKSLAQNLSEEKKYRESKDGIIYRVAPWYVKEFQRSFYVVEIEREE
jgi:hypothetical protein